MFRSLYTCVRNHWIKLYERKQNRWWSVEFSRNGMFLLKPRRVKVANAKRIFGNGHSNTFTDIKIRFTLDCGLNDKELSNFLSEAHNSMSNIYSRFRLNEGVFPVCVEIDNYELTGLSHNGVWGSITSTDVVFSFSFKHLRKYGP